MAKVIENAYVKMMDSRRNAAIKKTLPVVYDGKVDSSFEKLTEDIAELHDKLNANTPDRSKFFHLSSMEASLAEKHTAKKMKIGYHHDPIIQQHERHIDSLIDEHLHDPLVSVKVGKEIEDRSNGLDVKNELQHRYGYVIGRHSDVNLPQAEPDHQAEFTQKELEHHHSNGFVPYGNGIFRHIDAPLWANANFQHKDGNYYQVRGGNQKKLSELKNTPEHRQMLADHTKLSRMQLEPGRSWDAINDYTHDSSDLNRQLIENHIHGTPIEHPNRIHSAELSDSINNSDLPNHEFGVYTGLSKRINLKSIMDKHHDKSTVAVHFPAFTSTSLEQETARGFAGKKVEDKPYLKQGVDEILHMKIPANHKRGMYVDHGSKHPGEYEYLLDKSHVVHIPQQEPKYTFKHGNATRHYSGYVLPNGEHDN